MIFVVMQIFTAINFIVYKSNSSVPKVNFLIAVGLELVVWDTVIVPILMATIGR